MASCDSTGGFSIRRSRRVSRGFARGIRRLAGRGLTATLACLSLWYWVVGAWVSATCTAPPPITAQPAAQADNLAMAVRIDICAAFFATLARAAAAAGQHLLASCFYSTQRRERLTRQWR